MAFDHPKVYGEVESGPGVAAASQAAANWKEQVSTAFSEADAALARVLKDSEVMMQGGAGDQAREAVTPLSQATRGAIEVAAQSGAAVQQQAQGSADFKNAFPPPYQVPPDNIGWTDYVNPVSYGFKSGVRAAHEEKHDQIEAQARQQYESYTQATNERVNGIQQFPPPPTFAGDVSAASTTPVNKVDPSTSYTSTSTTSSTPSGSTTTGSQSSVPHTSTTPTPSAPTPSGQSSTSPSPQAPAESSSSWTTPPATAGGAPLPGTAAPVPAPGGGGLVGGAVIPPSGSGTGTPAPGTGGRTGTGVGTGTGRGATPGPGAGVRGGGPGAGALGGSGRSGTGVPGTTGSATAAGGTAARGGPGGPGGVAGAGGRGRGEGEEDKDHENKYVVENSELFEDLGLPKTAPPVFGDWGNDSGLPPRPPEKK
ncbi:hypothetical protein ABT324_00400 [Saccharopolyspora sp. NPDC000359]|uniref:hypothetical protein n=1 Tax=Saccharopolyspora sp. NPDC000359 TaxID=3154251 RepID=UPI0033294625